MLDMQPRNVLDVWARVVEPSCFRSQPKKHMVVVAAVVALVVVIVAVVIIVAVLVVGGVVVVVRFPFPSSRLTKLVQ